MAANRIESFIFLDLECSGFEAGNEIVEIAMISVHRQAIIDATDQGKSQPRVMDKLVLCVDPEVEVKYKESGLSQSLMESSGKTTFDEAVGNLVVQFLERQAKPACIIAHNGTEFDFLVLSKKMANVGVTIPEIRCGDSLKAFKCVQPERFNKRGAPYGLPNLYIRAFGRSQDNSHNAEADAVALMQVTMKEGSTILTWFDRNAVKKLPKYRYDTCARINLF